MGIVVDMIEFSLAASVWPEWVTHIFLSSVLSPELRAACESTRKTCPTVIFCQAIASFSCIDWAHSSARCDKYNLKVMHLWRDVKCSLEPAVQNQELVNTFVGWLNNGSHDMKSAFAALFTATQHTGVFYADGLEKRTFENNYGLLEALKTVSKLCKFYAIYIKKDYTSKYD